MRGTDCESCANFAYDEEYDEYYCDVNLDEDDMGRYMSHTFQCPYYQNGDEYRIVRKQI